MHKEKGLNAKSKSNRCNFKALDLYEKPILLTNDGLEGYRSNLGAVVSLVLFLLTVGFIAFKV